MNFIFMFQSMPLKSAADTKLAATRLSAAADIFELTVGDFALR